jgi:hypothetical protein
MLLVLGQEIIQLKEPFFSVVFAIGLLASRCFRRDKYFTTLMAATTFLLAAR